MANPQANLDYINILPGVTPITDDTSFAAQNFTFSDNIRFRKGLPEKVGGYTIQPFQFGQALNGVCRSMYSTEINGVIYTLYGTNSRLYCQVGSFLTNITPFLTTSTAASASLSTTYATLGSNPISVTNGSYVVTVTDTNAPRYQIGDLYTLSGATGTGGILAAALNTQHVIRNVGATTLTFNATTATSTAVGGGASVVAASGLVRVTVANTLAAGDRIKMAGAIAAGGITALQINLEYIARNISPTYFDIMTAGTATSSVSAAGGSGTVFYPPIPVGLVNESFGQGYGMGLYGTGLYGINRVSTSKHLYPQIWYFDRFGDFIMLTPGNGGALYEWTGNTATAPTITTNSPAAINYMFVSDNSVITFGQAGNENRISASDVGNRQTWTVTATNQAFDTIQQGASRFFCALKLQGINLLFTEQQVYTFQYIGLPNVWAIQLLGNIGIISSQAAWNINNVAVWMGIDNFYTWSGGVIDVMNSNVAPVSSILKYVFNNLNVAQKSKVFNYYDKAFQEWRIHYPSAGANEPDSVACTNILETTWWPDTVSRTAAETPTPLLTYQRLVDANGVVYNHEQTYDNAGSPAEFTLITNIRTLSKRETLLSAFIPDSIQTAGSITVTLDMFQWPNATINMSTQDYIVTQQPDLGRHQVGQTGRFWQYTIIGNALGQFWRAGKWAEEKQVSGDGA